MTADITILTTPRTKLGTTECRRLRRSGRIPANIYGHGEVPEAISVSEDDFRPVLVTGHRVVDLKIDGKTQKALVKELQWDTFSQFVQHIDFLRVDAKERMVVEVPVVLRGTAPGVLAGGVLNHQMHALEVEAPAVSIPDQIEVRILDLQLGQAIHVSDVQLPPEVTMKSEPDLIVVQVTHPVEVPEEEPAAGEILPTEPEVIGRKPAEEEEGEGK